MAKAGLSETMFQKQKDSEKWEVCVTGRWFEVEPMSDCKSYYNEDIGAKVSVNEVMSRAGPSSSSLLQFSSALMSVVSKV